MSRKEERAREGAVPLGRRSSRRDITDCLLQSLQPLVMAGHEGVEALGFVDEGGVGFGLLLDEPQLDAIRSLLSLQL